MALESSEHGVKKTRKARIGKTGWQAANATTIRPMTSRAPLEKELDSFLVNYGAGIIEIIQKLGSINTPGRYEELTKHRLTRLDKLIKIFEIYKKEEQSQ